MSEEKKTTKTPVKASSARSKAGVGTKTIKSKGKSGDAQKGLKTQKKGIAKIAEEETTPRKRGRPKMTPAQREKADKEREKRKAAKKAKQHEIVVLKRERDKLNRRIAKETGVSEETVAGKETVAGAGLPLPLLHDNSSMQTIGEDLPEGTNRKILMIGLRLMDLPDININDLGEVKQRLRTFMEIYMEQDMKPTVNGMANALGIDRRRLWEIATGQERAKWVNPECAEFITKTYHLLNQYWEEYMQNNKINPVSGIFLAKNHFGYRDQTDFVVTAHSDESTFDTDSIRAKYDSGSDSDS